MPRLRKVLIDAKQLGLHFFEVNPLKSDLNRLRKVRDKVSRLPYRLDAGLSTTVGGRSSLVTLTASKCLCRDTELPRHSVHSKDF
jgi:hypothetical protein